jgi:hypothetical protein
MPYVLYFMEMVLVVSSCSFLQYFITAKANANANADANADADADATADANADANATANANVLVTAALSQRLRSFLSL